MKRFILITLPLLLSADSFVEVLKKIDNSGLLKAKEYEVKAKDKMYGAAKGKNLFRIDASVQGIYLKEAPRMYMHLGIPGMPKSFQAASKEQYIGEVSISYPLFSGFAITNMIDKAKFEKELSYLKKLDLKRELFLKASFLYSAIYSSQKALDALKFAKEATGVSLKKARGFYDKGLIPVSEVYNIEAKDFEIKAKIEEVNANIKNLYEKLSYLTNSKIENIDNLPDMDVKSFKIDVENREDILAIKKGLDIDQKDIELAKSSFYPKLFLKAGIKGYGDDLDFDGDGYRNGDQSYATFVITQNIFNGLSDKNRLEAAKYKKMARFTFLNDYKRRVISDIKADIFVLNSLKEKLIWAQKRFKAQESYYELTKGRFENQLASADELSRSIASLAEAKANLEKIKSDIFYQKCKILLEISLKKFQKNFKL